MPRVQITLKDGSNKIVEFEDGFTDSDIDEVAGYLNSQIKTPALKPVQDTQPIKQPELQTQQEKKYNPLTATHEEKSEHIKQYYQKELDKRKEWEEKHPIISGIQKDYQPGYRAEIPRWELRAKYGLDAPLKEQLLSEAKQFGLNLVPAVNTAVDIATGGSGSVAKEGLKEILKQGAKTGVKTGVIGGATQGLTSSLADNGISWDLLKRPLMYSGMGLVLGAPLGASGALLGNVLGNVAKRGAKTPKVELKTSAEIVKPETINLIENEAVKRGLPIETAKAQIEKLQKGKEYRINNAARVKFTGEFDSSGMPIFENYKGTKQAYSLTNVFDEIPAIDKVTKKSLENQAKQLQNEISDSQIPIEQKTTIKMAKKGNFWSRNIDDSMTRDIRNAEEELNSIIKELQKNPELVKDVAQVESLENRLSNRLGIADEVDNDLLNRFYEAVNKANEVNETLALAGDYTQRGLPRTVINAKGTPKEVKQILKNDFPEYKILHNNELTEQAVQEVESNFNNELSRLTSAKDMEALDYEKSRQIAKRLFDMGRHEEAVNLIDNVSENATKKGQAIQALSLWSNMTPEGAVFKAEKLVKEYNKKVPARKQVKLTPEQIETIRQLQTEALNATDDLTKTQGIARTAKFVSELVPKNLGQKLKSYRNISLLLNPKTLGRNIIGNALFNTVDTVSKAAAVPIDRILGKIPNNRFFSTVEKTREFPQLNELVKGGIKGAKTGIQEALEGIDTRGLGKRYDLQEGRTFKNPVMRGLETALDVGLRVPDRTQYEATFAESVANMMKAQGLSQPTQEILEQAEKEALESVFQNDSLISKLTTDVRKGLNRIGTKEFGLGDLAIPYAQTPANLVQQAINYSPAGLIKGGANLLQGNQRQASLDLARALMGTGLILGSYGLSQNGTITPSQFDENYQKNKTIKANLATMGIKPETINGLWYAPFQPMSTSVAIGNAMASGEDPLQAGLNTMLDLPFLQNINKAINDVRDKGYVQAGLNFASSIPAQFVSTVGSQIGQVIDPVQREIYDSNKLMQGVNQAVAKIPGASKTLPEKIDVKGQPVQRYTSEGVQRMFDIFLNPTYITEPIDDTVMSELKVLYDETGDTKQFLPIVDKKISYKDKNGEDVKIELTGEQFSNYQKVLGSKLYQNYAELMQTNRYKNADDATRIKLLSEAKSKTRQQIDAELFNKPSVSSRKKVKDPTAKLKRLQNKIDKQLIESVIND